MAENWTKICTVSDLIASSGVAALVEGQQVAIFYLPQTEAQVYALDNHDPFSKVNVLSRGILGDLQGRMVVAAPVYKQHFDLLTGECLEDADVSVKVWPVRIDGDDVLLSA